jgi:hypothetical protein
VVHRVRMFRGLRVWLEADRYGTRPTLSVRNRVLSLPIGNRDTRDAVQSGKSRILIQVAAGWSYSNLSMPRFSPMPLHQYHRSQAA